MSFARATGDLHALSAVDTRLLALTHSIEVSYYGSSHLRDRPPPPKVQKKRVIDTKVLPGWGAEGGDWAEMDRLNEEELAAAEAVLSTTIEASRIASQVQELSLGGDDEDEDNNDDNDNEGEDGSRQQQQAAFLVESSAESEDDDDDDEDEDDDDDEDEDDDGEWEVAAKTKNKARRAKRKAFRRAEYTAAGMETLAVSTGDDNINSTDDDDEEDIEEDMEEEEIEEQQEEEEERKHPAGEESAVCCVTADFAMQNVLIQMGLRLSAPDGRQISTVSRWVLRCSACFQVTKEVGRLFCPRCGNAALDKVRVVVGPDGSEQYGVKKKHVLRGTKFSLPKPRGGRARDPILREDQLLTKKHLMRAAKAAEAKNELDPFAPEYNDDTWTNHQVAALPPGQGASALLAGWKNNPNERVHRATNRRRK